MPERLDHVPVFEGEVVPHEGGLLIVTLLPDGTPQGALLGGPVLADLDPGWLMSLLDEARRKRARSAAIA